MPAIAVPNAVTPSGASDGPTARTSSGLLPLVSAPPSTVPIVIVSFAASGSCTVDGKTVHLKGPGSCTITGSQPGNENFNAAPDISRTFSIARTPCTVPNIVGKSREMQRVFDLITQVAPSRATVLITGESGTGKEQVAKTIHATSARADQPFIPINTGSMPVDLLESTLFGHVKGAFTSAIATKRGLFEVADQGTIFFDEIGTVGVETQAKLLRVIQEREFMRLGGTETIHVDVRILAATNVDLKRLVQENKFREDLYYRLNVIAIPLPPLRERKEDIPLLLDHFLKKYSEENGRELRHFTLEAMKKMMDHDWPGNVRELENAVERAVVLSAGQALGLDLLPESIAVNGAHGGPRSSQLDYPEGSTLFDIVEGYERRLILDMLARSNWSQTEAAERFKIPLSTLNQKIKRLQIDVKRRREE